MVRIWILFFILSTSLYSISWANRPLVLIPMLQDYVKIDKESDVKYLNDKQRRDFEVYFKDGFIYDSFGELYHDEKMSSIFVVDRFGRFYAANVDDFENFNHSTFLSGKEVAGAGEMYIQNGRLVLLSNFSGHYLPNNTIAQQVEYLLFRHQVKPQFEQVLMSKDYLIDAIELNEFHWALKYKYSTNVKFEGANWVRQKLKLMNATIHSLPLPKPYCHSIFLF